MRPEHCSRWMAAAGLLAPVAVSAAPHRYDHVVIVIEENKTPGQIVGDTVNAPYITSLAAGGVSIGSIFALEHPSQPNYIQLFSGSDQGVQTDKLPAGFSTVATADYPFRAPNLGREILDAGFTFAGYCEGLETAGEEDWADYNPLVDVEYRRRHNPWANWVAKTSPVPPNQIPPELNRAFTQFPADYTALPTLCFVIPDLLHDMHDGTRGEGDDWLRTNLDGYAQWAKSHNSLLIVTWDEDDFAEINQVPTVFYGAALQNGTITGGTWTHHNLLHTLEDMYGSTTHAGAAAQVRSIVGPFTEDPPVATLTFRQGLNGYAGAVDTMIQKQSPNTTSSSATGLTSNRITTTQGSQILLKFDQIFGSSAGQIPSAAVIQSAKLILQSSASSRDTFGLHRMLAAWTGGATWAGLSGGAEINDMEAVNAPTFSLMPSVLIAPAIFDVTSDLEAFQSGTPNRGWLITAGASASGDGWTVRSCEYATDPALRPVLEVTYSTPPPASYSQWAAAAQLTAANNAPGADPDGDGADNLLECAFNLNPLVKDAVPFSMGTFGLPIGGLSEIGGLEMTFLRRKAVPGFGLTYTAEYSNDLSSWTAFEPVFITPVNAEWEQVSVHDDAAPTGAKTFARVVIGLTP
jgi:hypothetical protein